MPNLHDSNPVEYIREDEAHRGHAQPPQRLHVCKQFVVVMMRMGKIESGSETKETRLSVRPSQGT